MTTEEASERIAAAFEAGIAPWSRSTRLRITCGLPVDAATGQPIRGVNTWLLELAAIEKRYRNRFWATRRQWEDLGGVIVRGEGTPVLAEGEDEQTEGERVLFNLEQVEVRRGAPLAALDRFWVAPPSFPDYDLARRLLDATGARIVTGDRCHCLIYADGLETTSSCRRSGTSGAAQWLVVGHVPRVDPLGRPGAQSALLGRNYSQGELIAEIGATFLTNRCGIPMRRDLEGNGEHVDAWVNGIREDLGYLTHACAVAEVASSHVLNPSRWEMPA